MGNQQLIYCPGCGGRQHHDLGEMRIPVEALPSSPDALRAIVSATIPSRLLKCTACSLVFRERSLNSAQLCSFYEHLPEKHWDYDPACVGSWNFAYQELSKLYQEKCDVRILDIGAFDGTFLGGLPDKFKKCAIEPSIATVATLKDRGINRLAAFLEDDALNEELATFDCVTLLDVFEHLTRPQESFNRIASLLKPGGTFLLSTGNAGHWTMKMLKGRHWYFHSIQHVCVPDIHTIVHYARSANLRVLRSVSHSHQLRTGREWFDQLVETVYWHARLQGRVTRWPAALLQRVPRYRHLLHRTGSAKCDALNDHFLVVMQKLPTDS